MITVVIASYRYGHLAAHCIESILCQSKKPERIIFVDDGAGDCKHLPSIYPEIEYVLRSENWGVEKNFSNILGQINSEFTLFIGADNWLRSDAIELLSQTHTDIVTYDIVITGELKQQQAKRHASEVVAYQGDYYWSRRFMHHGSMLYRTRLAQQVGYKKRDSNAKYPEEDWNLWNEMLKNGATLSYLNQGLLFYRRHRENFLKYD